MGPARAAFFGYRLQPIRRDRLEAEPGSQAEAEPRSKCQTMLHIPPRPSPGDIYRFSPDDEDFFCIMCKKFWQGGDHESSDRHRQRLQDVAYWVSAADIAMARQKEQDDMNVWLARKRQFMEMEETWRRQGGHEHRLQAHPPPPPPPQCRSAATAGPPPYRGAATTGPPQEDEVPPPPPRGEPLIQRPLPPPPPRCSTASSGSTDRRGSAPEGSPGGVLRGPSTHQRS
jgi:hypothetical protein